MSGSIVVLGYGAAGRATVAALVARGDTVCVAQRSKPADLPAGVAFRSCDVFDAASVRRAIDGASQVVLAVGFPYDRNVWRTAWPATMRNLLAACKRGAKNGHTPKRLSNGNESSPCHTPGLGGMVCPWVDRSDPHHCPRGSA